MVQNALDKLVSRMYIINMKAKWSDKIRVLYNGYMEPILLTACEHQSEKIGSKTRSKYIRYAVIRALIEDGYPLKEVSKKFDKFYSEAKSKS